MPCLGRVTTGLRASWDFSCVCPPLVSWRDSAADRWPVFVCALRKCQAHLMEEMGKRRWLNKEVTKLARWIWTLIQETGYEFSTKTDKRLGCNSWHRRTSQKGLSLIEAWGLEGRSYFGFSSPLTVGKAEELRYSCSLVYSFSGLRALVKHLMFLNSPLSQ